MGIDGGFAVDILLAGAFRSDFQHPVRGLAHLPRKVELAGTDGIGVHSEGQVHVGGDADVEVARVIADVGLAVEKNVGATVEIGDVGAEKPDDFVQFAVLFHRVVRRLRHVGVEVQAGVVDFAPPTVGQH